MSKNPRNYLLLCLILVFAFIYRVVLMLRETFPPGADIGLHNSIINSITACQATRIFLYNDYHMGGGSSVTFPGYHIFTAYIILLTGMSDYVAQAVVVSFFSSFIVLVAFLLTRKIWNVSAAIIVAFLVAVSRFDIEMLMWGGYPNVITLMLMPLAFYLFLEKDRFSVVPFLVVTSLISGAIFLTHSLSALLFIAIVGVTVIFTAIFAGRMGVRRSGLIMWIMPLVFGAILIAPFLVQVLPVYLSSDAAAFTGGITAIKETLLATKLLPLGIVVPLLIFVFLYFLFSKYYTGKYISLPTMLLIFWWLIPTILTQGYLVGLYTDYTRFLYFVILPVIMLIGLGFYHSARFIGEALGWLASKAKELSQVRISKNKTLRRILPHLETKNFILIFLLIFILYVFLSVPLFAAPVGGVGLQTFYQVMNQPLYDGIQWAKANTPTNSVFVADAEYGWWFSGFAERPTIAAVEPEYLTNVREFQPATMASEVLDTDFLIDNGLIQVREDGGYIGRHNPDIYAKLPNSYYPYGFFNFDNSEITLTFRDQNGNVQIMDLSQVPVTNQYMENSSESASIFVTRANQYFAFTEEVTVSRGVSFANLTETLTSTSPGITFDTLKLLLYTTGMYIGGENANTIAFFATWSNVAGQLIFTQGQPMTDGSNFNSPGTLGLTYNLNAASSAQLSLSASAYAYPPIPSSDSSQQQQLSYYQSIISSHANTYLNTISNAPLDVFNYLQALAQYNVSYIVLRDLGQMPRFVNDPNFSLVFINDDVAIFKVVQK